MFQGSKPDPSSYADYPNLATYLIYKYVLSLYVIFPVLFGGISSYEREGEVDATSLYSYLRADA
jgi:hypothetical protein